MCLVKLVSQIKKGLIVQYNFPVDPKHPGTPLDVPDGEYRIEIGGRSFLAKVKDGLPSGEFEEEKELVS